MTNGGGTTNDRYSTLTAIDTTNVSKLKGSWITHLRKSGVAAKYSGESQPVEYRGTIYVTTGNDDPERVGEQGMVGQAAVCGASRARAGEAGEIESSLA